MPNLSSSKKALRQNIRRRARNLAKKRLITVKEKELRRAIAAGKKDAAVGALRELYSLIDKSVKSGLIKKNTAAREKSRLAKSIR